MGSVGGRALRLLEEFFEKIFMATIDSDFIGFNCSGFFFLSFCIQRVGGAF
jgi:hypothetical protein